MVPVEFLSGSSEGPVSSVLHAFLESEGKRYVAQARLQGQVMAEFTTAPRTLDFGRLKPGQKATQLVRVFRGALKDIRIAEPRVTSGPFEVSLVTNRAAFSPGEVAEIVVTFAAPITSSSLFFDGMLSFDTSSTRVPSTRIPISVSVIPDVETTPVVIVFPPHEKPGESRITIQTVRSSRLVRVLLITEDTQQAPQYADTTDNGNEGGRWGLRHVVQINNASIIKAKRVDFELEIQNGTGRSEARSASVHIRRL